MSRYQFQSLYSKTGEQESTKHREGDDDDVKYTKVKLQIVRVEVMVLFFLVFIGRVGRRGHKVWDQEGQEISLLLELKGLL